MSETADKTPLPGLWLRSYRTMSHWVIVLYALCSVNIFFHIFIEKCKTNKGIWNKSLKGGKGGCEKTGLSFFTAPLIFILL